MSIPARSSSAPSQSPVRALSIAVVPAIVRSAPRSPASRNVHRSGISSAVVPSGGCSRRMVSPSRNTVVIGCGSTPVRAKSSVCGHRLQHPLARGAVRRAIVAGQLEQATVGIHEPVVHPPGADRDACGRVSPIAARGEAGQRRLEQGLDIP